MRADKATNIANVAKELINDPLATQRELADRANVWLWTANRVKQEMEQNGTKDDRIIGITDTDLSILTIGQREIERRLNDKDEVEKMRTVEISQVIKESTARYSLFRGSATDDKWGLKETVTIEI
jgi:DNA-binding transcriptional regulator YhcF (GntR family)